MKKYLKKRIYKYFEKYLLINDTPHKVAGGAALGVFMGMTPGEGVLVALLLAYLFKLNRLAALAAVLAVNMWTTILILPFAAVVGGMIFRIDSTELMINFHESMDSGMAYLFSWNSLRDAGLPLFVGYGLIAGSAALLVYFGLSYLLIRRKKARESSHILTTDKLEFKIRTPEAKIK